jgi:hypothetical protein
MLTVTLALRPVEAAIPVTDRHRNPITVLLDLDVDPLRRIPGRGAPLDDDLDVALVPRPDLDRTVEG